MTTRPRLNVPGDGMHDRNAEGITVCVCGGGNAAHVAAGMYSHHGATVNLFLSLENEAEEWRTALQHGITVHRNQEGDQYTGYVHIASTHAADVVPAANLILIIVPAFAHRPILESIAPHLRDGAMILAMPAPGAFDLLARHVLGDKANRVIVAGTVCLPWACRIKQYAREVELLGEKSPVMLVARPAQGAQRVIDVANEIHDRTRFEAATLFVQATLFPTNPILHPGIMWAKWHDWDGQPLDSKPVFYEGVDDVTAAVLEGEDKDIQAIRRALEAELGQHLYIPTMIEQMVEGYGRQIADPTNYQTMLATNSALAGLYHPMKRTADGKYEPDFSYRYLWEDIPFGLCAMKGIADLINVPTPHFDKILLWAQKQMGKEYLVGGCWSGKDVGSTACPQAYGLTDKTAFLAELKHQLESAATRAGSLAGRHH